MTRPISTITAGNPACLHCTIMYAIGLFTTIHGPRDPSTGHPALVLSDVIAKLSDVIAELIQQLPDPTVRAEFQSHARTCLDAAFVASATGKPVAVDLDQPRSRH